MRPGANIAALSTALLAVAAPCRSDALSLGYMYDLADTSGPIRENPGDVWYDAQAREVFVVGYGVVRIFSETGMETFSFRLDPALGYPVGVAALESGDLLVLARRSGESVVLRCNYRGEYEGELALAGVPAELAAGFRPSAIRRAAGKTYLADLTGMKIVVVDDAGQYVASHDIGRMLELDGQQDSVGLSGFSVARDGSLLFTIATLFQAYVMAPDGTLRAWGKPGGAPGMFNVVKGIAADERGRFYVLDSLKSAVIAFDGELKFIGEFGYRGDQPGNLSYPTAIAFGDRRVYVAQNGNRGVSVFSVNE